MRRYFRSLLNAALLVVVIGQVWSIRTCPPMTDPSDCGHYPAGCGPFCTADWVMARYSCCCDVRDHRTAQTVGCCLAWCELWACRYFITSDPCEWDVDFDGFYLDNGFCAYLAGGQTMEGGCVIPEPVPPGPEPEPTRADLGR